MSNQSIIDQFQDAMLKVEGDAVTKSAFYLQQYSLLITSAIGLETVGEVKLYDKTFKEYSSLVLYFDSKHDLVFLQVPESWQGPDLALGASSLLRAGDKVTAIGFEPDAEEASMQGEVLEPVSVQDGLNYIYVTADMHYGNTGGPLVNERGEVIGVNSENVDAGIDFGYGLPLDYLLEALDLYMPHHGKVAVRCQHCNSLVLQEASDSEHCSACQEELSFPETENVTVDSIHSLIEKSIRMTGKSVSESKVEFERWCIREGRVRIDISYLFRDYLVVMETVLAKYPADAEKIMAVDQFLLEENAQLSGITISKSNNLLTLGAIFDEEEYDVETGAKALSSMLENADRYIGLLTEKYGCPV